VRITLVLATNQQAINRTRCKVEYRVYYVTTICDENLMGFGVFLSLKFDPVHLAKPPERNMFPFSGKFETTNKERMARFMNTGKRDTLSQSPPSNFQIFLC
jgi:hypothetical protein